VAEKREREKESEREIERKIEHVTSATEAGLKL
jgi:hypothetical protein